MGDSVKLSANDFIQLLKDAGMVVGPKTVFDSFLVKGIPVDQYRARIIRKKLLTQKEIAEAHIWGFITKAAVKVIVKNQVPPQVIIKAPGGTFLIPVGIVKSIAISRGVYFTEL